MLLLQNLKASRIFKNFSWITWRLFFKYNGACTIHPDIEDTLHSCFENFWRCPCFEKLTWISSRTSSKLREWTRTRSTTPAPDSSSMTSSRRTGDWNKRGGLNLILNSMFWLYSPRRKSIFLFVQKFLVNFIFFYPNCMYRVRQHNFIFIMRGNQAVEVVAEWTCFHSRDEILKFHWKYS